MIQLTVLMLSLFAVQAIDPQAIFTRYLEATGGQAAVRAVKSRITEGVFDNGRGLRTRFRIVEEAPNRKATIIGTDAIGGVLGSGRGYDGTSGWDKSFVGTGLRVLEGGELADVARDADISRALHLLDDCATTTVAGSGRTNDVTCTRKSGGIVKYSFDKQSGLLVSQETAGSGATVQINYSEYRKVDDLTLPFKIRIQVPGATLEYAAESIRQNQPVDRNVFQRPPQ